jgi:hypothetical protein
VARKVFQHFAQVLCQRFVEVPSNRDLINLAILGGGRIVLDITAGKATWNRYPVEPLPYATEAKLWIENQLAARKIAHDQLVGASLIIDYGVRVAPSATEGIFQTGRLNSAVRAQSCRRTGSTLRT